MTLLQRVDAYLSGTGLLTEESALLIECAIALQAAERIKEATDKAYSERNQLVALLSTLYPSGKAMTAIPGWDEAWHNCAYIDFPWGQASWHYHDKDAWMFEHLGPYYREWDGHTTEEKYNRIANAVKNGC